LLEGLFCEECDKWCDKKGGGRSSFSDGIFSFCSSEHRFIITEKNELKHLQEQ
jgi:hypothetical protein